jgi:GNAT superfamily N-acetyltransferase
MQVLKNSPLIADESYALLRLDTHDDFNDKVIQSFDCGDDDLTGFFRKDAFDYHQQLLATTYFLQPIKAIEEEIFFPVAFISFMNDSVKLSQEERKTTKKKFFNKLKKQMPFQKRGYEDFPAVKIGRLGVSRDYQGQQIGTRLINLSKEVFITNNRTGCRYLTVDAYNRKDQRTINFYQKNDFDFLSDLDINKNTRIMWFDLTTFKKQD